MSVSTAPAYMLASAPDEAMVPQVGWTYRVRRLTGKTAALRATHNADGAAITSVIFDFDVPRGQFDDHFVPAKGL